MTYHEVEYGLYTTKEIGILMMEEIYREQKRKSFLYSRSKRNIMIESDHEYSYMIRFMLLTPIEIFSNIIKFI